MRNTHRLVFCLFLWMSCAPVTGENGSLAGEKKSSLKPGDFAWKVDTSTRVVALTFDDGPGDHTERVLALLKAHGVKATFFMMGENVLEHPDVAKKVAQEGHEIANHTYSHVNYAKTDKTVGTEKLRASIRKTQEILLQQTGQTSRFCRMPHGITRAWINEAAREEGVVLVNWTFGYDWFNLTPAETLESYEKNLRPGSIILMHDGGKRGKTLYVLERFLKILKNRGYATLTVGEILERYPASPLPRARKKRP
ncbi:MAG TPA: polysaccharide deacetylase family protein [Elusimicrobiota bacterium]|nr:polysaccharide deacetylase family protein [Elusimicrobiota bacterium]